MRIHSALNSTFNSSALLLLHSCLLSHRVFWRVRFKKRSKIEQKDIITPMHCLAFPSALFGAPFHIDNRTIADCGFWLEYASKTPLEVGADLPRRMHLFWLRCQIMRLRNVHIKPHYSQNAFDSALLAWYERGISQSYFFSPKGFDLGRVDCISLFLCSSLSHSSNVLTLSFFYFPPVHYSCFTLSLFTPLSSPYSYFLWKFEPSSVNKRKGREKEKDQEGNNKKRRANLACCQADRNVCANSQSQAQNSGTRRVNTRLVPGFGLNKWQIT